MNPAKKTNKFPQLVIQQIDCRVGLSKLTANSISVVITDPPYFIDGMGDDWDDAKLTKKTARAAVVGGLPVGMKFDPRQSKQLREFLEPIAEQWLRITKPGGFVLCFMQPRLAHAAAMAMENAGLQIKDMFVWQRNGQAKAFTQDHFVAKRNDLSQLEKEQLIRSLGGRKTPQLRPLSETIILGQVPNEGTFVDNWEKWGVGLIDVENPFIATDSFPSTIMPVPRPKERYGHLTAKPVDLLRHLIRIFAGNNPTVLDTFAGCGSTGEAAALAGCDFIGFEIEKRYTRRAKQRLQQSLSRARRKIELSQASQQAKVLNVSFLADKVVKLPREKSTLGYWSAIVIQESSNSGRNDSIAELVRAQLPNLDRVQQVRQLLRDR